MLETSTDSLGSKLPSSHKRKSVRMGSSKRIANAPLSSASLPDSPANKIRLLIYNRKGMLNLVDSTEDATMRENSVGNGLLLELTLRHFIAYFCSASWLHRDHKASKNTLCKIVCVFINLPWWLQVGHHSTRRSRVPAQTSSHAHGITNAHIVTEIRSPTASFLAAFPRLRVHPTPLSKLTLCFSLLSAHFHSAARLSWTNGTV